MGLQAPPAYKISVHPRPARDGLLRLVEGDTVRFGFVQDVPEADNPEGEESEESSDPGGGSSGESTAEEERGDTGRPRGPPSPQPRHPLVGRASWSRSRSRSSHNPRDDGCVGIRDDPSLTAATSKDYCSNKLDPMLFADPLPGSDIWPRSPLWPLWQGLVVDPLPASWPHAQFCFDGSPPRHCPFGAEAADGSFVCKRGPRSCRVPDATPSPGTRQYAQVSTDILARRIVNRGDRSPERPPYPAFETHRPTAGGVQPLVAPLQGYFVVLAFGYRPDISTLQLAVPCSVGAALQEVQRFRLEPQSRRFPRLIVVTPQPAREFGVFLAGPAWPHRAVQVLLDSRDVNGKIFPVYVDGHCTRESILHAAGVGRGAPLQVYFATDSEPMAQGQVLAPFEGALFRLVHFRAAPAPLPFLEDMLRSTLHWDLQASLPFAFGPHLWLLSDSEPMRFDLDNPQMTVRSTEVARMLGYHPDRIALRPPMPPLVDYFSCGWSMAAVLVASELFPRTFASDVGPFVLVLDQRPVLQDVIWRVLAEPQVLVQELADDYADTCPDGYSVAFFGAEVLAGPEGEVFQVASCTCIRVEFVVILHFDSDDEGPGSPVSDSEVRTEASETASAPPTSASSPHTQAASDGTLSHSGDAPSDGLAGPPLPTYAFKEA